mmetsp:Transcript_95431/g.168602  ORF Transcript_95431/g.168602 Transcript_95431/m.168602 type:complete len:204 (-) Transcript_95431:946-1557(-)
MHLRSCVGLCFMMPSVTMTARLGSCSLMLGTLRSMATTPRACAGRPLRQRRACTWRCARTAAVTTSRARRGARCPPGTGCTSWTWSSAQGTPRGVADVLFLLLDFLHPCLFEASPSLVLLVVESNVDRRLSRRLPFVCLRLGRHCRWLALNGCFTSTSLALPIAAVPWHPALAWRSGRPRPTSRPISRLWLRSPRMNIWGWRL